MNYSVRIIISEENAPKYLLNHGFVATSKTKKYWKLNNSYRFTTQEALQALAISLLSNALNNQYEYR